MFGSVLTTRNTREDRKLENSIKNVPLLKKALEHVTEHPEEHDQESWFSRKWTKGDWCGTTACLAGTIAWMEGWTPIFPKGNSRTTSECQRGDKQEQVDLVALHALGAQTQGARLLFGANNTLPQLWGLANELTDGEIEVPREMKIRYLRDEIKELEADIQDGYTSILTVSEVALRRKQLAKLEQEEIQDDRANHGVSQT